MNKKVTYGIITGVLIIATILIGVGIYAFNQAENVSGNKNSNDSGLASNARSEAIERKTENSVKTEKTDESSENRILIAFFSRADENYSVGTVEVGNTEIMAGFIKDYFGEKADLFKIDPVKAYPADYKACTDFATYEQEQNARPQFKGDVDLSKYSTIFIGYPIWCGAVPMIINTFLEKYDFSGKTIIPFNTHEGSGNAGTFNYIKNKMTDSTVNTKGLSIRGSIARNEESSSTVRDWLKELEY